MSETDTVRVLSFHAAYACRHSGACCSAGWRIPIDPARRDALERAAHAGRLPGRAARTDSGGGLTVLQLAGDATCAAFESPRAGRASMCAIHRVLGPEALPTACRHFPRVCRLDPRGASITLSHFCPTAAGLLFEDSPIRAVAAPPAFTDLHELEGFDARDALPPLLAPGMLTDLDAFSAFEEWALRVLDAATRSPADASTAEGALDVLRAGADHCRTWTPRDGPLIDRVRELDHAVGPAWTHSHPDPDPAEAAARAFREVLACVPDGLTHPGVPEQFHALDRALVAPCWPAWTAPLGRYVAARLHASWTAYQGQGLRTLVRSLSSSLAVVRVEAIRQCGVAGRRLDRRLLVEAIRAADLLLVHEAESGALARTWATEELETRSVRGA